MHRKLKTLSSKHDYDQGFTLPMVVVIGAAMLLIAATLLIVAIKNSAIASGRNRTGESSQVAEAGVTRTLVQFTKLENAVLLNRNFDPINPSTGKNYLGVDGISNSGDETTVAVDEWTGFSPIASPCAAVPTPGSPNFNFSGKIGTDGEYQLLAYRYDSTDKTGTFLVAGQIASDHTKLSTSNIGVKVSLLDNFPGVVSNHPNVDSDLITMAERSVVGSNGNVYFNPASAYDSSSLSGSAAPGEVNRGTYLNAINAKTDDNISGKIFACQLISNMPYTPQGTDLGDLTTDKNIYGISGQIAYYQANKIEIVDKTIDVDTANGQVYLYVKGKFIMKGNSKIRNWRSDGKPPRVGDLRIIVALDQSSGQTAEISDTACIQTAFLYNPNGDLKLSSSGSGCDSGNSNIDGVVWVEDIQNDIGSTAGITVPDDVSSLADIIDQVNLPTINKLGSIKNWQRY